MDSQIKSFIGSAFPSVWALELLLLLADDAGRAFTRQETVTMLRASDAVVARCGDALVAAGLVVEEGADRLRFAPASRDLADLVERTRALYRSRPDAVRRLIVVGASGGLDAFADAFRLRKDSE
jgi:hypothetical protein